MTLNSGVKRYKNFDFQADQVENSYCPSFDKSIDEMRTIMKTICKRNHGTLLECKPNGYECTIVIANDSPNAKEKYCYVNFGDVRHGKNGYEDVLIRAMKYQNDGTGKQNNKCKLVELEKAINDIFIKGGFNSGCE